jgi:hypothetical protein
MNLKIFFYPKCGSTRYFFWLIGSLESSEFGLNFWGKISAVCDGPKMRSSYVHYPPPVRKCQILLVILAALGDQIIRNFKVQKQLAVLN